MISMVTSLINIVQLIMNSWQLLFTVYAISFALKMNLLGYLAYKKLRNTKIPYQIYFLMFISFSSLVIDIAWLLTPFNTYLDFRIYNTAIRLAWVFFIILYQT